jgi:hypothetical protein
MTPAAAVVASAAATANAASRCSPSQFRFSHGEGARPEPFEASVGVFREAPLFAAVHRVVGGPRPAPELGALIVGDRLLDLVTGIHHEGAVRGHGLSDWPSLQYQEFALTFARFELECHVASNRQRGVRRHGLFADASRRTSEEVERARRFFARGRRQRQASARIHPDAPDGDVAVRA